MLVLFYKKWHDCLTQISNLSMDESHLGLHTHILIPWAWGCRLELQADGEEQTGRSSSPARRSVTGGEEQQPGGEQQPTGAAALREQCDRRGGACPAISSA